MATNIQVAVRIRPFLPFETGSKSVIDVLPGEDDPPAEKIVQGRSVRIAGSSRKSHAFTFDRCFSGLADQVEIYNSLIIPLLSSCLEGYNATTLAYGQTGAGKTYTTLGPSAATSPDFFLPHNINKRTAEFDAVGILPRTLRDIFIQLERKRLSSSSVIDSENDSDGVEVGLQTVKQPKSNRAENEKKPFEYTVKLQFLELYGEDIRDLLSTGSAQTKKIVIRDSSDDAEAMGATEQVVSTAQEAMVCLTRGMLHRVTGATAMNAESSRSHAIMSVIIEQTSRTYDGDGEAVVNRKSKFNFIDLAGAERQKRTNAKGQRLKEGININKGLLVLGNVISALASGDKKSFVPFRDSKLTRLLRGSLGGNHKTLMIACASPAPKNAEESLNCLRYANRAKQIKNLAVVNVDPHSRLVNQLRGQVTALAGELLRLSNKGGKVDNDRFAVEMLRALVSGGKDAQAITIPKKGETSPAEPNPSSPASAVKPGTMDKDSAVGEEASKEVVKLTAELKEARQSLKVTQRTLKETSEQLEAAISERDAANDQLSDQKKNETSAASYATPSKAKGSSRNESIREIVTSLSSADDILSDSGHLYPAVVNGSSSVGVDAASAAKVVALENKVKELSTEVETLRSSMKNAAAEVNRKNEEIESTLEELVDALEENEKLRERIRDTADIDEDTIRYIIKNVSSYSGQNLLESEFEEESVDASSVGTSDEETDDATKQQNEQLCIFASAMFCTGKFLVDCGRFEESITCFETVLEARRELFGWDDPLVGDALHMEGFVRSKMGDYDRALMLLWDALRIRKISSDPLKIAATLRLLADLHFSKEENMHSALFYEECARHLKEHDIHDPHLPLVLIDLARTKDRLGEYQGSMNFFEEALSLYEHSLDYDDDRIASLQYEMGVLAFQMGERERGEECFRQFIRIRKAKGSKMDEGVANALFVLGSLHWACKRKDLAQDCWVEALDIFKALGRKDDPYVKSLKEKIERARRRPIGRLFRGS
mmetsp:Transcript_24424/g.54664  ORF Transcript_24424/g.54664 Transcript_24424/m.54664 type:complete len:1002 (+) Transcript_24424:261-3266(+)